MRKASKWKKMIGISEMDEKIISGTNFRLIYRSLSFFFFSFFFVFLRPHLWHMEVPRLGVELEL